MVQRVYVEKKEGFSPEANALEKECISFLGITNLKKLRILNRYDVEGISLEDFNLAKKTIFSEAQVDIIYDSFLDFKHDACFAIEALPGQFDQRADSAAQCIELLTQKDRPIVRYAKLILLYGDLSEDDINKIKAYTINPVENKEASLALPDSLIEEIPLANDIEILDGFINKDENELEIFRQDYGLAMAIDDLLFLQDYFKELNRNPSICELRVVDTYWSDHCRHTTFSTVLETINIEDERVLDTYNLYQDLRQEVYGDNLKDETLMDLATIGSKVLRKRGKCENLDISEEINACSIKVEDWLLMFKNETHNHPTEIEPFGGAATCIGGCIRDPLSGRVYVHQAMRLTGGGNPNEALQDTLKGKLPQRKIAQTASSGYSSYGNQIGLATGLVSEIYHEGYKAKRLECGVVVGANKQENIIRQRPRAGDMIILLGGRTGRDGIGGATGSSKTHNLSSLETMASEVQKGNAPQERKIQRLFRNPDVTKMIKRCNDFGAGGVSVAIGELAPGIHVNLDLVRKKYEGLDGTELAISESQERMAVVVDKKDVDRFIDYALKENLEAYVVAEVTDDDKLVMNWKDERIVDIDRCFLDSNGAKKKTEVFVEKNNQDNILKMPYTNLIEMATDLKCASRKGLSEKFDSTVGAYNVLFPFGGKYKATSENKMVSLFPYMPEEENDLASIMAWGYDPDISSLDPYKGAYYAVYNSIAKCVSGGANPTEIYLSFQEFFGRLHNDPKKWAKPFSALLGALQAQIETECAAIGGKDSMSGSFMDKDVPPTLISFAISPIKVDNVVSADFKKENHKVILIDSLDSSINEQYKLFHNLVMQGKVFASRTCELGIAESLMNMCFGNRIGFSSNNNLDYYISRPMAIIAEVEDDVNIGEIIGYTTKEEIINLNNESISITDLEKYNSEILEDVYPSKVNNINENIPTLSYENSKERIHYPIILNDKPIALIPVFPGTNCEYDTAHALIEAGAKPEIFIIQNGSSLQVQESVKEFAKKIDEAHMIIIPGGFSGGDEPEGSAKFITSFFRNPAIEKSLAAFLDERKGLMLGICNGFQALVKLGLVPYGKIIEPDKDAPTLTYNTIGRHQSQISRIRVVSNMSPWLADFNVGDIFETPISHGEGRFIISEAQAKALHENGQIVTQYVDIDGIASMNIPDNPNGSFWAIEGICNKDGRILGKMGHVERYRKGIYKNIYGEKDMQIFKSAVKYFK